MTKIAILTQPLGHNYGGILQAYALQKYLRLQGCNVTTVDYRKQSPNFIKALKIKTRHVINLKKGKLRSLPSHKKERIVYSNLLEFIKDNINTSKLINNEKDLINYFNENNFDLIIVGSDQVWRPKYSPLIDNFYASFYNDLIVKPKIISYAASFGVDSWEYTTEQTLRFTNYISKFSGISVREESGVRLCSQNFEKKAIRVLDPTMLLERDVYLDLLKCSSKANDNGLLLNYVLDSSDEKKKLIEKISRLLNLKSFSLKAENEYFNLPNSELKNSKYKSVEEWIQSFSESRFVVTDSFHGCVFSIIFNRPFIVVGNVERGLARFESILSIFGLNNRLVTDIEHITEEKLLEKIDWESVNSVLENQRKSSSEFLKKFVK